MSKTAEGASAAADAVAYTFADGTEITAREAIDEIIEASRLGDEHEEYLKEILTALPDSILGTDEGGRTALHMAAGNGHVQMLKILLASSVKPDVNAKTSNGSTPLHWAVVNTHVPCVSLLLEAGARVDILTAAGDAPIDLLPSIRDEAVREEIEKLLLAAAPEDNDGDIADKILDSADMADDGDDSDSSDADAPAGGAAAAASQ